MLNLATLTPVEAAELCHILLADLMELEEWAFARHPYGEHVLCALRSISRGKSNAELAYERGLAPPERKRDPGEGTSLKELLEESARAFEYLEKLGPPEPEEAVDLCEGLAERMASFGRATVV